MAPEPTREDVTRPTFQPYDVVRWDPMMLERHKTIPLVEKHGDGPFIIETARDVPSVCDCGARDSGHPHLERCSIDALRSVAHHQYVQLVGINGAFSGAWFLPTHE